MQVDAHQHFWNPARGDYGWMPKNDPVLSQSYMPLDLAPEIAVAGVDATILVQAAATVAETEYILGIADATPFVAGVVGWINFEDASQAAVLKRLSGHPKVKGLRPMIQDIADDTWMLRDDVQWAFRAIADLELSFDALGFSRHLKLFLNVLQHYPSLRMVIDHCMKPAIRDPAEQSFNTWAEGMARLAEAGAYCKLSGLITEAAPGWTVADLAPYAAHVLEAFGPDRVMWGSDWPVCRLRGEYGDWRDAALTLTAGLSAVDRAMVFGGTAAAFYRLG